MLPDKRRKKELLQQFKQNEVAEARRKMCLAPDQLRDLLGYLDEQMFGLGIPCDHTLARTETWAKQQGIDPNNVLQSVREFGGYCDCEVSYNVKPHLFGWAEEEPHEE